MESSDPFIKYLSSSSGHWIRAQFVLVVYAAVIYLRLDRLTQWAFDFVKVDYYYVGGACRHSGNCCRGINLVISGKSIDTVHDFDEVVSQGKYSQFVPEMADSETIRSFRCLNLDKTNRCRDYQNRPKICRDYPYSMYVNEGRIHRDCGYKIKRRLFKTPLWVPRRIKQALAIFETENQIVP